MTNTFKAVDLDGDWWCTCGKGDPHSPFDVVDRDGNECEPMVGVEFYYRCTGCRTMYDACMQPAEVA